MVDNHQKYILSDHKWHSYPKQSLWWLLLSMQLKKAMKISSSLQLICSGLSLQYWFVFNGCCVKEKKANKTLVCNMQNHKLVWTLPKQQHWHTNRPATIMVIMRDFSVYLKSFNLLLVKIYFPSHMKTWLNKR